VTKFATQYFDRSFRSRSIRFRFRSRSFRVRFSVIGFSAHPYAFHHQLEHRHCLFITSGSHRRLSHLNNNSYRATASSPSTSPSTAAFSHQLQQLPPPGLLFSLLQHSSNTFFLLKPNLFQQHHSNHLQGALPCMVVPPLQASRPCSSAAHLFPQPRTTKLETSPSCLLP
jgi:hypothetical protein